MTMPPIRTFTTGGLTPERVPAKPAVLKGELRLRVCMTLAPLRAE
jgi:hypothetical protein